MSNQTVELGLSRRDAGNRQMPRAVAVGASGFADRLGALTTRLFVSVLGSLHRSRRRHARRIISEHRHLTVQARQRDVARIPARRS